MKLATLPDSVDSERPGTLRAVLVSDMEAPLLVRLPQRAGWAIMVIRTFSACRESGRECCTTIGTLDSVTLA